MNTTKTDKSKVAQAAAVSPVLSNEHMAENIVAPEASAATIVMTYTKEHDVSLGIAVMKQLQAQQRRLASGDMSDAENMLMSQAVALQAIFTKLALRAVSANGSEQIQCLLGLALRAQSGCRATLEALGDLKFPRQATFVKQANIANGNQQVNNGVTHAHAITPDAANKLSRPDHELQQDAGTSSATVTSDSNLAAVGKVYRAEVRRR